MVIIAQKHVKRKSLKGTFSSKCIKKWSENVKVRIITVLTTWLFILQCGKLSTNFHACFVGNVSYTRSYPHYPQSLWILMNEDYCFFKTKICFVKTHELHKPTKNFMKRLDKKVIRKFIF